MDEPTKHGILTHELASELGKLLVAETYELFTDPHSNERNLLPPVNYGEITPHLGQECIRGTSLSDCDIMVATKQPRNAVLLIEVEEKVAGATPKTIIGDFFNVWMAKAIHCKEKSYELKDTKLWVVVFDPKTPGSGKSNQYGALQDCFDKLAKCFQYELHGRVGITETRIVPVPTGQGCLVKEVIANIRKDLPDLLIPESAAAAQTAPLQPLIPTERTISI